MFDSYVVVYKFLGDLMFYVTGSQDENELILYTVLQAFYESVSVLLRYEDRPSRACSHDNLTGVNVEWAQATSREENRAREPRSRPFVHGRDRGRRVRVIFACR